MEVSSFCIKGTRVSQFAMAIVGKICEPSSSLARFPLCCGMDKAWRGTLTWTPRPQMTTKHLVIASLSAPVGIGGLAAYSRTLAEKVQERIAIRGEFICLDATPLKLPAQRAPIWPISCLGIHLLWRLIRRSVLNRMASR